MRRVSRVLAVVLGGLCVTACRGEVLLGGESADGGVDAGGAVASAALDASGSSSGSSSGGSSSTSGGSGGAGPCSVPAAGGGAPGTPVVLATVQAPAAIAVDGKNVYWASYEIGPVGAVPITGGPSTTLDNISATTVAIDSTRVYTVSPSGGNAPQGLVVACAKTGCGGNPTTMASGQNGVWGVAVDDTNVYWTSQGAPGAMPGVFKVPLAGGSPTALVTGISATSIAVNAGYAFFTGVQGGGWANLLRVPVAGGAPTLVYAADTGDSVEGVTTDCANVYFSTTNGIIGQVPLAGGSVRILSTNEGNGIIGLAVDAARVFWAAHDSGKIRAVPIGGGSVSTLASGQKGPVGIAVDDTSVYWANMGDGTIMKTSK